MASAANGPRYAKFAVGEFGFSPLRISVVGRSVLPNPLILDESVNPGSVLWLTAWAQPARRVRGNHLRRRTN